MSYAGMGLHPQINIFTNLGSTMIPDIHALISYLHQSNVGTLGTSSVIQYGGGLGAKFFVFRSNWMALTLAVDFLFNKSSGTTTKSISVPIGIRAYF